MTSGLVAGGACQAIETSEESKVEIRQHCSQIKQIEVAMEFDSTSTANQQRHRTSKCSSFCQRSYRGRLKDTTNTSKQTTSTFIHIDIAILIPLVDS